MEQPSPKRRPAMLASVIREAIAPVLREAPGECGIVTITEIEVSSDASYATVFVSALNEKERAMAFLEERRPHLQKMLGSAVSVHHTPKLRFRFDDRGERGERIERLLSGDQ